MSELIYPKDCYELYGIFFEIQNDLGTKFQEKYYSRGIESKFIQHKIFHQKEVPIKVYYQGKLLGKFKADFIVKNKIILEIKATNCITQEHVKQMIRYLEATGLKLGLIVNFRVRPLEIKRVVNSKVK
ncbi:MAG: GxxExxY protein [Parcubacteria group bacterium CG_4_10_14_0_8_um_filter_35_7]|nr:MAG: GxxExxY protein [Parcubacteria group bacterium CG23_combo_of_CG06-09_8_20_14_all_35_9]PIY78698.1 MAG: GxxExxY protein [Parcubacteria group bacterium CG_4_10_14_0_8_um_filter_35_7]